MSASQVGASPQDPTRDKDPDQLPAAEEKL
jgi:hypothetical protein